MGDFIRPQLLEYCKIAMPDGLRELMADISREVLRAQPVNLYKFIADYLAALLVTRENLTIACQICGDVCKNTCHTALNEELKDIGFDDDQAADAAETITNYFANGGFKESILMQKLMKDVDIRTDQLEDIKVAIYNTFLRQKIKSKLIDDSDEVEDDVARAVAHTMTLYNQTSPSKGQSCKMAQRIQAAYKGHNVRRNRKTSTKKHGVDVFKFSLRGNRSESYSDLENTESVEHQSEEKLSAAGELAEIAEIEFATFDYTHTGEITIKKPKIYDRKSRENSLSVQFEDDQEKTSDNNVPSKEGYYCNDDNAEIPEEIECFEEHDTEEINHFEEYETQEIEEHNIEDIEYSEEHNSKKIEHPEENHNGEVDHSGKYGNTEYANETIQDATIYTKFNLDGSLRNLSMGTSDNAEDKTGNLLGIKESGSNNLKNEGAHEINGVISPEEEIIYSNIGKKEINSKSLSMIAEQNDERDSDQE